MFFVQFSTKCKKIFECLKLLIYLNLFNLNLLILLKSLYYSSSRWQWRKLCLLVNVFVFMFVKANWQSSWSGGKRLFWYLPILFIFVFVFVFLKLSWHSIVGNALRKVIPQTFLHWRLLTIKELGISERRISTMFYRPHFECFRFMYLYLHWFDLPLSPCQR